eukprot:TRINITY_DN2512_c0_g2_i2.p1 TRINITY_DN2512_c0_g2~~TRINITY_DN2512_c0_g2_i2.p1  ORF type:complete len:360 (-),score=44.26 TRINITY_DN2512_c0_g2_i2:465-1466(-)
MVVMVATLASEPMDPLGNDHGGSIAASLDAEAPSEPTERYTMECVLGSGVFGTVHKAVDTVTGQTVAIKRLHYSGMGKRDEAVPSSVFRECALLRQLSHPNVVQLLAVNVRDTVELVFEFVAMDLFKLIKKYRETQTFLLREVLGKYTAELLAGIHACHSRLIVHRDLKPQNILIGQGGLKICDFGLARAQILRPAPYTREVITLWYRPPELLLGAHLYGPEVDMWSAGCIIAEMATSWPLFSGDSEIGTLFAIMKMLGTPSEQSWPGVSSLPNWHAAFPQWKHVGVERVLEKRADVPQIGGELLQGLLKFVPHARMKAGAASRAAQKVLSLC